MASLGSSVELSSAARDLTWTAHGSKTGIAASRHYHQSIERYTDYNPQEWSPCSPTTQKSDWNSASSLSTSAAWHHRKRPHAEPCPRRQPHFRPSSHLTRDRTVQTMQAYMQPAMNALRHPASLLNRVSSQAANTTPQDLMSQVRGMSNAQWASIGVVAAEVVGFFSIGEIIGRFKLVGYRAKEHHGDH
jgi:hypothetical protein